MKTDAFCNLLTSFVVECDENKLEFSLFKNHASLYSKLSWTRILHYFVIY